MSQKILLEKEGGVATITFNRPESANALNSELGKELIRVLEEIEKDASVRALVITGAVIDAKEAERIGLVKKAVPPNELNEVVAVLANRLANGPTFALKMTKKALYNSLSNDIAMQLNFEAYAQSLCF